MTLSGFHFQLRKEVDAAYNAFVYRLTIVTFFIIKLLNLIITSCNSYNLRISNDHVLLTPLSRVRAGEIGFKAQYLLYTIWAPRFYLPGIFCD